MNQIIDNLINQLQSKQELSNTTKDQFDMQEKASIKRPAFPSRDGTTSIINRTKPSAGPRTAE